MVEYRRQGGFITNNQTMDYDWRVISILSAISPGWFPGFEFRLNDVVYTKYTPEFEEAYNIEYMWGKISV